MDKYYTPSIEDIYVGYGYEHYNVLSKQWVNDLIEEPIESWNTKIDDHVNFEEDIKAGHVRTPYLTKEQIEAEGGGWVFGNFLTEGSNDQDEITEGFEKFISDTLWYTLEMLEDHKILIQKRYYRNSVTQIWETVYLGQCLSINEFRKLCKWIGI